MLLTECEAVVNSLPLTHLGDESLEYIRPIDFLIPKLKVTVDSGQRDKGDIFQPSSTEKLLENWRPSQDRSKDSGISGKSPVQPARVRGIN